MSEMRKSRQPGHDPPRLSRDPRIDSTPPAALDEAPLAHLQHVAHTFTRPPQTERLATLEAEVERLRGELASDADDTAGMLVRIAESERMHVSAHALAIEAGTRASVLEADLEAATQRVRALEGELAALRQQWSLSETRLGAARESVRNALAMVEELERREEMAAAIRARTLRDALHALRGDSLPPASAESSVDLRGPRDAHGARDGFPDGDWDLDFAK
jgi:septal ring factor EnvC (AmiA/AmiB activator)